MVENRFGMKMCKSILDRNLLMELRSRESQMSFFIFVYRFRFQSAFNSFSVACEAFSDQEQRHFYSSSPPISIKLELLS
uniref:Uncharacterized protein n=1 Tax=Manihot esculenta TaxID=3983 RepID=A0A2C9WBY3_MANES